MTKLNLEKGSKYFAQDWIYIYAKALLTVYLTLESTWQSGTSLLVFVSWILGLGHRVAFIQQFFNLAFVSFVFFSNDA